MSMTPEQFQEKHNRRLKGATEDIRNGINAVSQAPGQKAAAKSKKMLANLTESVNSGAWAARTAAVGLDEWKQKTLDKGVARIGSGIDAAADKVRSFASQLLPYTDSVSQKVASMPDMTLDDNIRRAEVAMREMAKFRKK